MLHPRWIFVSPASDDLIRVLEVRNYLESKAASPLLFHLLALKRADEFWPVIERESAIADEREWVRRERGTVERVRKEKPIRVGAIRVDGPELALDELDRFIAKTRVFPTFAHRDRELVSPFLLALERAGFQVFKDIDLPVGAVFKDAIEHEVRKAAENGWVIAFLTSAAMASPYVQAEIAMARAMGGKFLAVVLDGVPVPVNLAATQILDGMA